MPEDITRARKVWYAMHGRFIRLSVCPSQVEVAPKRLKGGITQTTPHHNTCTMVF